MDYKINPAKATCMKYPNQVQDLQSINDTCFGICASFSDSINVFSMDPACTKSCEDLVENRKREIFGVGSCDHQAPYKPVIWGQVPRYVPKLLKKGVTLENARAQCKQMCDKTVPMLNLECREACDLDANAVEVDAPTPIPARPREMRLVGDTPPPSNKNRNIMIWVFLFFLLFGIVMFFLFRKLL